MKGEGLSAVATAEEQVRIDASNRMQHNTTSDLSARLMCRVGFHELTLLLAHYDGLKRAHAARTAGPELAYARRLATVAAENFGPPAGWKPLDDMMGVLSQIDNALTMLSRTAGPVGGEVDLEAIIHIIGTTVEVDHSWVAPRVSVSSVVDAARQIAALRTPDQSLQPPDG